jgi:hypothetical protein
LPTITFISTKSAWADKGVETVSNEETSESVASLAARGLADPGSLSHNEIKSICGSALTQRENDGGETILVEQTVDYDKVANAFVGLIEGGYSPWLHSFTIAPDDLSQTLRRALQLGDKIWYAEGSFWHDGGSACVKFDHPDDDEGTGNGEMQIGKCEIILGLRRMAMFAPRHFADLVNENDDAITHDVFGQFCILGAIVYG